MSYELLKKELKENKLTRLLHFYGEERYLLNRYVNIIKERVVGDSETFNLTVMDGDVSEADIDVSFETPPLMGDSKLILLKNTGVFTLKNTHRELWKEKFSRCADYVYVIACEDSFDKRSPAYRAFAEKCLSVEFARRGRGDLKAWVSRLVAAAGKKIGNDATDLFLDSTGSDMYSVEAGINKLIAAAGNGAEITKKSVEDIITVEYFTKEYVYTDALLARNGEKAVNALRELLEMGNDPIKLLYIVASAFLSTYKAKLMLADDETPAAIAKRLRLPSDFMAKKYTGFAKNLSEEYLVSAVGLIKSADLEMKTGTSQPETIIITLTNELLFLS